MPEGLMLMGQIYCGGKLYECCIYHIQKDLENTIMQGQGQEAGLQCPQLKRNAKEKPAYSLQSRFYTIPIRLIQPVYE